MSLADELNAASESLTGGQRIKAADLVNQTFDILGFFVEDGTDREGNPKVSYVGEIVYEGERHQAWLNGYRVAEQLKLAKQRDAFPCRVKLLLVEKAYQLKFIETNLINAEPDGFE
jgi:hypothetical protein